MQNRREFLKVTSGALALGDLFLPDFSVASVAPKIPEPGVQLFTFFSVLDKDVQGTMRKIADLGIINIESAFSRKGDYYGLKPNEFSALVKGLGMTWRAHHVFGAPAKQSSTSQLPPVKNLVENTQQIIDDASEAGIEYLVAAHFPLGTGQEISAALAILNKAAEATKKVGIQLVYHNETADFTTIEGKVPMEVFLNDSDADKLKFELDMSWAIKAGVDPISLFAKHPGRFPLWHVKDLSKDSTTILPIGEGELDYKRYFASVPQSGLTYYFIEHESPADPFASVAASVAHLKKITG